MRILLTIVCLVASVAARDLGNTPQQHVKTTAVPIGWWKSIAQGFSNLRTLDVQFWLYTRKNQTGTKLDRNSPKTIRSSTFDSSLPIKIVVHGFYSDHTSNFTKNMTEAFLKKEDLNVILVDWGHAMQEYHSAATFYVPRVARETYELLRTLHLQFGVPMKNVHVIGHSLGAHIAGFVGHNVFIELNQFIPRITGLDPAGPEFTGYTPEDRLDSHDADFVDVIHTNAGGKWGLNENIGDVDFYPNGGNNQPGCGTNLFRGNAKLACSHSRAWELFTESIQYDSSNGFKAYPCTNYDKFKRGECFTCENDNSCGQMGYVVIGKGVYYLDTADKPPYKV